MNREKREKGNLMAREELMKVLRIKDNEIEKKNRQVESTKREMEDWVFFLQREL